MVEGRRVVRRADTRWGLDPLAEMTDAPALEAGMGLVVSLADDFDSHAASLSLEAAPRHRKLRDAVEDVILAIHGLPAVMNAQLPQLEVYVGRAGATPGHLRNRWSARFEAFERAPSTTALVALRASTSTVQSERWERTAQLLINSLTRNGALCCANALTGDSGRWPDTEDCAIYIVARRRRGPVGRGVSERALNSVVAELIEDDSLDAHVVRAASRQILNPDRGTAHARYEGGGDSENEDEVMTESGVAYCRTDGCSHRARRGNYGFCGKHRPYTPPGMPMCKDCGRPALAGNYGFCGFHRRA